MKLFSELRISFYSDIDIESSLIRQLILRRYFPKIQIQQMPEIDGKKNELQIYGIKKILISVKKFVELPIILLSNDNEEVRLQIKIYVVDRFLIDILLKNNFFRSNDINILILSPINGLPVLQIQGYFITLEEPRRPINPPKTSRKRTVIKTAETLIIIIGIGQNILIFYKEKHLPR
jgi:hypothetical protein